MEDNTQGDAVVNGVAEDVTAATESTTVENNDTQGADSEPKMKTVIGDDGEVRQVPDEDDKTDEDDDSKDQPQKKGAEARAAQLNQETAQANEAIRELVAMKNEALARQHQLEQELQQMRQSTHQSQIPTVEDITSRENPETGDYYTEFEAKAIIQNMELSQQLEHLQQQQEQREQEAQISASIDGMSRDVERALSEFSIFDDQSQDYNPTLAAAVDAQVEAALIRDPRTGAVIGSRVPIYQTYKMVFDAAQGNVAAQQQLQQQAAATQAASADVRGSGSGSSKAFKDMSLQEMEASLKRKGHFK